MRCYRKRTRNKQDVKHILIDPIVSETFVDARKDLEGAAIEIGTSKRFGVAFSLSIQSHQVCFAFTSSRHLHGTCAFYVLMVSLMLFP